MDFFSINIILLEFPISCWTKVTTYCSSIYVANFFSFVYIILLNKQEYSSIQTKLYTYKQSFLATMLVKELV